MFFRRSPPSAATAPLSDQELLARYRAHGDVADLGRLYDRYLPEAFAVCRRYLAPPDEDAQDAAMQLFEHLVKVLRTHAPDNFPAWLHTTARNHCLMQLRARTAGRADQGSVQSLARIAVVISPEAVSGHMPESCPYQDPPIPPVSASSRNSHSWLMADR